MAKIYISSTYEDLKKEREAAVQAIRRLGHQHISMEDYVASDKLPIDKCLDDIRNCDAYVGIFAWRYGFIPEGYQKSMAHLEYEAANKDKKPCLIFLLDKKAPWTVANISTGEERIKIDRLREKLQKKHLVSFFTDADQLGYLVSKAVSNTFKPSLKKSKYGSMTNRKTLGLFSKEKTKEVSRIKWIVVAASIIITFITFIIILGNQSKVSPPKDIIEKNAQPTVIQGNEIEGKSMEITADIKL